MIENNFSTPKRCGSCGATVVSRGFRKSYGIGREPSHGSSVPRFPKSRRWMAWQSSSWRLPYVGFSRPIVAVWQLAGAKDSLADTHHGGTFFDGDLEIAGHAHR